MCESRKQLLPVSHPVKQRLQAAAGRRADTAQPGQDRRPATDKRHRPVACPSRQSRSVLVEHPFHSLRRQAQLTGRSSRAWPGASGPRHALSEYHARRGTFQLRQKVRAHQGQGRAASPHLIGILEHQRASPGHTVAQLVSQLGEERRPAKHRSRPGPHQPERALSHAAANTLCRCGQGHQEGSRVTILRAQTQPQRIAAHSREGGRQPFGQHVSRRCLENRHATGRRALERAMPCFRTRSRRR